MLNSLLELPGRAEDLFARRFFGREHFIVLRDHPIAYGRVPKAANSTVKHMLTRLLSVRDRNVSPDSYWKNHHLGEASMVRTRDAARLPENVLVFTFVRNPLERLCSFQDNKIADPNAGLPEVARKMGLDKAMDFRRVVEIICDTPVHKMDVHVLPQSEILLYRGALVPRFVGRHETFAEDWQELSRRSLALGGPDLGEPRPRRKERIRGMADYFDAALLAKVKRKYEADFRLFYPELL
jgi:hypothetical protein